MDRRTESLSMLRVSVLMRDKNGEDTLELLACMYVF